MDSILYKINKKSWLGAPTVLNYAAMINSLFIRIIERIPTIKDSIKRLNNDLIFKLHCGFLVSDVVPSEASYSRLITKLKESDILEKNKGTVVSQTIFEGFITDDAVPIDATHFEARDQAPPKEESQKQSLKNAVDSQRLSVNNG